MQVHIIQLPEWRWSGTPNKELDRWMYLFTQGENVDMDNPPEILQVKEMEPAMETMKRFSEKELEYGLYERRRLAVMDAKALQAYMDELKTDVQTKEAELERERKEKERLLYLLKQSGIDPGQRG